MFVTGSGGFHGYESPQYLLTPVNAIQASPNLGQITGNAIGDGFVIELAPSPSINCAAADGLWHADNISVACTAFESLPGLASQSDAAFSLRTSVPSGVETANAATGTRQVCDVNSTCSTAGPVGNNKVDRRAPAIQIDTPADGSTFIVGQQISASYSCTDGGSGVEYWLL